MFVLIRRAAALATFDCILALDGVTWCWRRRRGGGMLIRSLETLIRG